MQYRELTETMLDNDITETFLNMIQMEKAIREFGPTVLDDLRFTDRGWDIPSSMDCDVLLGLLELLETIKHYKTLLQEDDVMIHKYEMDITDLKDYLWDESVELVEELPSQRQLVVKETATTIHIKKEQLESEEADKEQNSQERQSQEEEPDGGDQDVQLESLSTSKVQEGPPPERYDQTSRATNDVKRIKEDITIAICNEFGLNEEKSFETLHASFFHPSYKGKTWVDEQRYEDFLAKFINLDPTTIQFYAAKDNDTGKKGPPQKLPIQKKKMPLHYRNMLRIQEMERKKFQTRNRDVPPVRKEIDEYLAYHQLYETIDVLQYWKENAEKLPLLSKKAMLLLAEPISLPTSNLTRETEDVVPWENSPIRLMPDQYEKLLFIQLNGKKLDVDMNTWNFPQV